MGSVANDYGCVGRMVGLAFYADKWEVRVFSKRSDEILGLDQRCYAGEVGVEKGGDGGGVCLKSGEVCRWEEQCAGE